MGNRLSKIYTRTGDDGTTALADGKRIHKSEGVFEVMGDIDELNSHIGMAKSLYESQQHNPQTINVQTTTVQTTSVRTAETTTTDTINLANTLTIIQHLLFNIGGELAMPNMGYQGVEQTHIDWLETQIDAMNEQLQPLKEFILPAGNQLMCQLHIARAVCRRAERHAVQLQKQTNHNSECAINKTSIQLLNRLSDWLFVASRFEGLKLTEAQSKEILWDKNILNDAVTKSHTGN